MDVRDVQYLNAWPPMLVTPSGITMDVRDSQFANARMEMLLAGKGIAIRWSPFD